MILTDQDKCNKAELFKLLDIAKSRTPYNPECDGNTV